MPDLPVPTVSTAIHGPYEDAIIAMGEIAKTIVASMPADAQAQFWAQHIARVDRLITMGEKLRAFFHID